MGGEKAPEVDTYQGQSTVLFYHYCAGYEGGAGLGAALIEQDFLLRSGPPYLR
jgi:hypothetical protein